MTLSSKLFIQLQLLNEFPLGTAFTFPCLMLTAHEYWVENISHVLIRQYYLLAFLQDLCTSTATN